MREKINLRTYGADLFALRGAEACSDFEGLLLQGRATLDRLTWFITTQFKNRSQSFRKMAAVLSNFEQNNSEARALLAIVKAADNWFDGTFGRLQESKSLRDLVAHYGALTERIRTFFAVTRVSPNSALIIDCEVSLPNQSRPLPILATAHESAKWLSYIVLNCAATMMTVPQLPVEAYRPLWQNLTVVLSDYVIPEPEGSPLGSHVLHTVRTMTLDGFVNGTDNVDPSILERAIQI
jgi:hypothetical protein